MKIIKVFFLGTLIFTLSWAQPNTLNGLIDLPAGYKHQILLNPLDKTPQAHLFTMDSNGHSKVSFISRIRFKGDFNYQSIEQQCRQNRQEIALQVASAFTPDWKVIEGFALQQGQSGGQDSFPGQNANLPYKGILAIKDGLPFFTHLDSIKSIQLFKEKALAEKWSLFMQAAPIVNGRPDTSLILPGTFKRRFFVEIEADKREFGVITFLDKTTYMQAVRIMYGQKEMGINIKNAVYLDMGSVSEGYVYDQNAKKYLIGNSGTYMYKYTNMLVMLRE